MSCYLTEAENGALLDKLASLAAPGSRLGVDMAGRALLDNPAMAAHLQLLSSDGAEWRFGTDDPREFLSAHGWSASVSDFHAVARDLGRWPPAGMSESLAVRFAEAIRASFISAEPSGPSEPSVPRACRTRPSRA